MCMREKTLLFPSLMLHWEEQTGIHQKAFKKLQFLRMGLTLVAGEDLREDMHYRFVS